MGLRQVNLGEEFASAQCLIKVVGDPTMPQTFWVGKNWLTQYLLKIPNLIRWGWLAKFKWNKQAIFNVSPDLAKKGFSVAFRNYEGRMFLLDFGRPIRNQFFQMFMGKEHFEVIVLDHNNKPSPPNTVVMVGFGQSL